MHAIENLFTETGIITASDAAKNGFEKAAFYQYVKENNLERIGHGIYIREDAWPDDLFVLHKRCPAAVFSHEEALYYHNLSDREPIRHTLTIYTGYNTKRLVDSGCKVYTVKKDLLDVGKVIVKNHCGNDVPLYDLERTICDIVRSRRNIEIQEFHTALKAYVQRKDKDLNKLMSYAQLFHVDKIIRQYMEVLL
ncbi:MAG: abortive phage infection protein [Erysipelotrichaceae bacterium]|nr:abortive phage infection protein [Erysipelotrichaceae bacterium]